MTTRVTVTVEFEESRASGRRVETVVETLRNVADRLETSREVRTASDKELRGLCQEGTVRVTVVTKATKK